MAKGIIGQPFTFTVLYVDANGDPITPTCTFNELEAVASWARC